MKGKQAEWDVIIIGGGPAGLSAALILARCRRKVMVLDSQDYRNAASSGIHALPGFDGIKPAVYLKQLQKDVMKYDVKIQYAKATRVIQGPQFFEIEDALMKKYTASKILLATGVRDILPSIPEIKKFYGSSVLHCPYCDGYEQKGKIVGVIGAGKKGVNYAYALTSWSDRVILFYEGKKLNGEYQQLLDNNNITCFREKIIALKGKGKLLQAIILENNQEVKCDVLFFDSHKRLRSDIPVNLKCKLTPKGVVCTNKKQETSIRGIFSAGDSTVDVMMVSEACAEGIAAGMSIHKQLLSEAM
ncbi:MAG: NAD(P)/FAD-dependent oxidoreductase [Chitinophagales bacterium]|nr:NAD(P)/FAD-dependent oxidoreductase [Chitinophagales bacterium]